MICPNSLKAQDDFLEIVEYENVKNQLFIQFPVINGDTVAEYSVDKRNNFLDLKKEQNFTQKNNITINVGWLNPINFSVSIEDTLIADPTSKVVSDFITSLTGQFGISPFESEDGGAIKSTENVSQFNDPDLALWAKEYIDLYKELELAVENSEEETKKAEKVFERAVAAHAVAVENANKPKATASTIKKKDDAEAALNTARSDLENAIDNTAKVKKRFSGLKSVYSNIKNELPIIDKYLANDFSSSVTSIFGKLKSINEPYSVRDKKGSYDEATKSLKTINVSHSDASKNLTKIEKLFSSGIDQINTSLSFNQGFQFYTVAFFKKYIAKSKTDIAARNKSLEALKKIIGHLDKSVTGQNITESNNALFVKLKDVNRERGKISKIEMTLKKYTYANNDLSSKTEKVHSKHVLLFQPYRFLIPQVSVGVFYSSLELKTFEAGVDASGNTIVEESTQESGPVYATNLNFFLNTKNSDLLPFFQLGIDPTKERPFLLAGGGLAIPGSRFAISGGLAWTWRQSLKTLTVNGAADSNAAIKDDIEYTFDESPRVYFGLQYEF